VAWVDYAIIGALAVAAVLGFRRGLLQQVVELAGLLFGIMLALYLTGGLVQDYAGPAAGWRITPPLVFMSIVGVSMLVAQVVGRIASEVVEVTFFGWFDQLGGALAGIGKGALWLSILITVVLHLDLNPQVNRQVSESKLGPPLVELLPAAFHVVQNYAKDVNLREPFQAATR
jgi:uncharacterized membrane protein required for colicin V production